MNFDEIYKPPFHDFFGIGVATKDGVRCFDWVVRMPHESKLAIIDLLNSNGEKPVKKEVKYNKDGYVSIDGINIMVLRGWGHLTGRGALNLSPEEAIEIQDDFGEWIVKKLKQEI